MKDNYGAIRRNQPKPRRRTRRGHPLLRLLLLAVICFGGAELAFCRLFAPALFKQITDPVVQPVVRAAERVQARVKLIRFQRLRDELAVQVLAGTGEYYIPRPVIFPEYVERPTPTPAPTPQPPPAATELIRRDGLELLTGQVPCVYYNQGDDAWKDKLFGSDPIGTYGCGPTVMAMVVSSLAGKQMDPAQMAAWAYENGYWCSGSGSYLTIINGTCKAFGLDSVQDKQCTAEKLYSHLEGGGYAIALVGSGTFTHSNGHFILLRGVSNGSILIADPNSRKNSLALWDAPLILEEAASSSGDGVGIWLVSPGGGQGS